MPTQKFREDVDSAVNKYVVDPIKNVGTRLKENILGTDEERAKSAAEMAEAAKKYPEGLEATYAKVVGKKKGGKVSSASKRADGCATKGKTRGRIV